MVRYWQRGNATRAYHGYATRLTSLGVTVHTNTPVLQDTRIEVEFVSDRGGFIAEAVVEEAKAVPLELQRIKTGYMRLRLLSLEDLIRENFTREQLGLDPPPEDASPNTSFPKVKRDWQPKAGEAGADGQAGSTPSTLAKTATGARGAAEKTLAAAPKAAEPSLPIFFVTFARRDFLRRFELDIRWGEMFIKTPSPAPIGIQICVRVSVEGEVPVELAAVVVDKIHAVAGASKTVDTGMKVRFTDRDAIMRMSALAYSRR